MGDQVDGEFGTWSCHYCVSAHSVSRVQIQDPSSGGKPGVLIPWCTYSCHVLEYRMVVEVVVVKVEVMLGGP